MISTDSRAGRALLAVLTFAMAGAGGCAGDLTQPGFKLQAQAERTPARTADARRAAPPQAMPTPAPPPGPKPPEKAPAPAYTPPREVPGLAARRPPGLKPDVTFVIRLTSLEDMSDLDARPGVAEVIDAALRYPDSQIYVTVYVTAGDTQARHSDSTNLADQLVIDMARFLADRGIDPERITGKGAGIDEAVGRALVVSLAGTGPARGRKPPPSGVRPTSFRSGAGPQLSSR